MANPKPQASKYPAYLWTAYGLNPIPEWKFHPTRLWRFDFAFQNQMCGVEIEGGLFSGGRHNRGAGYLKDMEKYNAAAALGWRLFRFTPQQLKRGEAQVYMLKVLKGVL